MRRLYFGERGVDARSCTGARVSDQQSTLLHEAGHIVGALLAGHHIEVVRLGGSERNTNYVGTTVLDWAASPDVDYYGHLITVLMGPMAEGDPPPGWPPLPHVDGVPDEHVSARLVSYLSLSKSEYVLAVALAEHWLNDPLVKASIAKLARALGEAGSLTDRMIRDVLGPGLIGWFEMRARAEDRQLCGS